MNEDCGSRRSLIFILHPRFPTLHRHLQHDQQHHTMEKKSERIIMKTITVHSTNNIITKSKTLSHGFITDLILDGCKHSLKSAMNLSCVRADGGDKLKSTLVRNLTIFSHFLLTADSQKSVRKNIARSRLTITATSGIICLPKHLGIFSYGYH